MGAMQIQTRLYKNNGISSLEEVCIIPVSKSGEKAARTNDTGQDTDKQRKLCSICAD